jgi:hypothetical protein
MEDHVIDIKLISCKALSRVNPLLVSNDKDFRWRTIHNLSSDTTRDYFVLLVELRDGNSYVLDPSFMALDPSGSYEKPYGIFRTDDRELNKWYKHMEFAVDFCSYTSMKVISEYQGVANLLNTVDNEFCSSLCTVLQSFNNPGLTVSRREKKKKKKKKKKKCEKKIDKTLKTVKNSMNIQRSIEDFENETPEEKQLADSIEKILLDDAAMMLLT